MILSTNSYAQNLDTNPDQQGMGQNPDMEGDSTEVKKKKPFSSYLFADSLKQTRIFAWRYNSLNNSVQRVDVDTMLNGFNREYLFQNKEGISSNYLGNLGAPTSPVEYSERDMSTNFSFLNAYKEYLFTPENVVFYNTKVAFSQFSYITSGQTDRAEELFDLTHAQNISPSTGFNISYRNNRTKGLYTNQKSINKNFSFAFSHTGKRYTTHFGYIFNSGEIEENGGASDLSEIRDTVINLPENIAVNLQDAKTKFKGNGFYYSQSLAIPLSRNTSIDSILMSVQGKNLSALDSLKMIRQQRIESSDVATNSILFLGMAMDFMSYKKLYSDSQAYTEEGYYDNWYIDPDYTQDSIRETNFNLKFYAQVQPFNQSGPVSLIGGGVGYSNEGYYYFSPSNYITGGSKVQKKSMFVFGDAKGKWSRYLAWDAHLKYYPIGYRSQDFTAGGTLKLAAYIRNRPIILTANAEFITEGASYWEENFYSNHFQWSNNFDQEVRTEIKGSLVIPSINLEIGGTQVLSTNTVYYNNLSLPTQYTGALSVTSAYISKNFVAGVLHLNNKVLLQTTSNANVAPVPNFAADISYFLRLDVVKDILQMDLGFNGKYYTEYYGYAYNPAISQFYTQQEVKVGGYPMLDAFVTGKWKRLRFLIKFQHANYELFGGRNYFDIANYPLNRRMLKYGISWSFYD